MNCTISKSTKISKLLQYYMDGPKEFYVQMAGDTSVLSNQFAQHPGVYRCDELMVAQNRSADEDSGKLVSSEALATLFGSLNWSKIDVGASARSLVQEIWRWFVIVMLIALMVEAILCMPKRRQASLVGKAV